MELLRVSEVSKQERKEWILNGVSFSQEKSRKLAIAGESGSGKTTLLKIIAGLLQPDGGEVWFGGERVKGPHEKLMPGHPDIAYLSQHFELHNNYRIEDLLSYKNHLSDEESQALYDLCRIDHLLKRKNDQISGGERQRIALAKLLGGHPRLLLLDEPFSNLDLGHTNTLKSVIRDIGERLQITCLLVSHDPPDILSWADKVLVMKAGRIIQQGIPERIYRQPVDEYTAGLFGKYNLLSDSAGRVLPEITLPEMTVNADAAKGKRMLIRPEDLRILNPRDDLPTGAPAKASISGVVGRVVFSGGYSDVEVVLGGNTITVRLIGSHRFDGGFPAIGETVHLSFDPAALCYV